MGAARGAACSWKGLLLLLLLPCAAVRSSCVCAAQQPQTRPHCAVLKHVPVPSSSSSSSSSQGASPSTLENLKHAHAPKSSSLHSRKHSTTAQLYASGSTLAVQSTYFHDAHEVRDVTEREGGREGNDVAMMGEGVPQEHQKRHHVGAVKMPFMEMTGGRSELCGRVLGLRGGATSPAPLIPVEVYRYRFVACFLNDFFNLYRNLRSSFLPVLHKAYATTRAFAADAIRKRRHGGRTAAVMVDSSMHGKVCLVTGANRGIGREIVKQLLLRGAHVILACRSVERGKQTAEELQKETGSARMSVRAVDLTSLESVSRFATSLNEEELCLDVLVNNAAVYPLTYNKTKDNVEESFQVTHLSHLTLTMLLMPCLARVEAREAGHPQGDAGPARVINLVSKCESMAKLAQVEAAYLDSDDRAADEKYDALGEYAVANLATTMSTFALARALSQACILRSNRSSESGNIAVGQRSVVVCACSPGRARTGLFGAVSLGGKMLALAARACGMSAWRAAQGVVWLASSDKALDLFRAAHPFVSGKHKALHKPGPEALDQDACMRVLDRSAALADALLARDMGYRADLFEIAQDLSRVGVIGKHQIDVLVNVAQQSQRMSVSAANVFLHVYARYEVSDGARRRCRELLNIFRDPERFGYEIDGALPKSILERAKLDDGVEDGYDSSDSSSSLSDTSQQVYDDAVSGRAHRRRPPQADSHQAGDAAAASAADQQAPNPSPFNGAEPAFSELGKGISVGARQGSLSPKRSSVSPRRASTASSAGVKMPIVRGRGTPPRKQEQTSTAPLGTPVGASVGAKASSFKDAWGILASRVKREEGQQGWGGGGDENEWITGTPVRTPSGTPLRTPLGTPLGSSVFDSDAGVQNAYGYTPMRTERSGVRELQDTPQSTEKRQPTPGRMEVKAEKVKEKLKLSRSELERMCEERGISTAGKKKELMQRLKAFSSTQKI